MYGVINERTLQMSTFYINEYSNQFLYRARALLFATIINCWSEKSRNSQSHNIIKTSFLLEINPVRLYSIALNDSVAFAWIQTAKGFLTEKTSWVVRDIWETFGVQLKRVYTILNGYRNIRIFLETVGNTRRDYKFRSLRGPYRVLATSSYNLHQRKFVNSFYNI